MTDLCCEQIENWDQGTIKTPSKAVAKKTEGKQAVAKADGIPGRILKLGVDGVAVDWQAAAKAFGSSDVNFLVGLAKQLANIEAGASAPDENNIAYQASIVAGIAPRDATEALLATQMAAIHSSIITMTGRLRNAETILQQDSAERALNKLARTYVMQVDALGRHRRGGKQKVVVEHVTINEGGQAIVGNVERSKPKA